MSGTTTTIRLPASVAAFVRERIERFAAEADEKVRRLAPAVRAHGALPLFLGWTETHGLRPDGALVWWSTEEEEPGGGPVEHGITALTILVAGARRYPALAVLLPLRPPDARACPTCGAHAEAWAERGLLCGACGGLGWLTPTP